MACRSDALTSQLKRLARRGSKRTGMAYSRVLDFHQRLSRLEVFRLGDRYFFDGYRSTLFVEDGGFLGLGDVDHDDDW